MLEPEDRKLIELVDEHTQPPKLSATSRARLDDALEARIAERARGRLRFAIALGLAGAIAAILLVFALSRSDTDTPSTDTPHTSVVASAAETELPDAVGASADPLREDTSTNPVAEPAPLILDIHPERPILDTQALLPAEYQAVDALLFSISGVSP